MEIMTICTGNICRSPLAELIIAARLADLGAVVHSAGVRGLNSARMTPEAAHLAVHLGVTQEASDAHRSRYLTEAMLGPPDLILTMTRDHRRDVAELAPSRLRSTFTVREFARLASTVSDEQLVAAANGAGDDSGQRLRAAVALVASMRGLAPAPADPADDDVVDPYKQPWEVYVESADQLVPALEQVERVARLAA